MGLFGNIFASLSGDTLRGHEERALGNNNSGTEGTPQYPLGDEQTAPDGRTDVIDNLSRKTPKD